MRVGPSAWMNARVHLILVGVAGMCSVLAMLAGGCSAPSTELDGALWARYLEKFVSAEGRVVDTGQSGISHSEGQGYGMLLAEAFGDRGHFDLLWAWTRTHLQVREDSLLAWKWSPIDPDGPVSDMNNATDGDILVAWALERASRRWTDPAYRDASLEILSDIRGKLLRHTNHGLMLLPGERGFVRPDGLVVNLSYWVFPALLAFQAVEPDAEWRELARSGHTLLRQARFGEWQLPPDWLYVGESLELPSDFRTGFGYDAIRIPLYWVWAGGDDDELTAPLVAYAKRFRMGTGDETYPATAGVRAVVDLTLDARGHVRQESGRPSEFPPDEDYYSSTLWLLSQVARVEAGLATPRVGNER